ncbi:MAG: 1,4-alpha-glucan branching protein GlgB [Rhodospirillales bacterium]|nr:1,4-alpha-glucan branching protein GlgB [Rhodospirillales bacterium]
MSRKPRASHPARRGSEARPDGALQPKPPLPADERLAAAAAVGDEVLEPPVQARRPAGRAKPRPTATATKEPPGKPVEPANTAAPPEPAAEAAAPQPAPEPAATAAPERAPDPAPDPEPEPVIHVPAEALAPADGIAAVLAADHRDPFGFFGMHRYQGDGPLLVRAFLPEASRVGVVDAATGDVVAELPRVHDAGVFAGVVPGRSERFAYRLRAQIGGENEGGEIRGGEIDVEDAYRFPPVLSEADAHLLAEGSHLESYRRLGAHPMRLDGVDGVAFAVWAPHASRVAVIGEFNGWDGRRHGMRLRHECGVWEIFLPNVRPGQLYKYEIKGPGGALLTDKCDPFAFFVEKSPGSAAIVCDLDAYRWGDGEWMQKRSRYNGREAPISIYEVHLPSWRRRPEEGHRWLSYRELADELVGYVREMGFTHIELLPIAEFDFDGSLGYQPFAMFAPTSRWGTPDDFRLLVDRCHQAGIGVIADWVPFHFSDDPHGLRLFDGTHLYEHPDPRQRRHPGWNTLIYDYGRREVSSYLVSNALFWLKEYHIDGLRIPAVASMLYLDYGRARGEWTPNRHGGHENLDAIDVLRRVNAAIEAQAPGTFTIAEESSAWPSVTHPPAFGGLGFGYRWNTGWVRDALRYVSRNPVHRKYYHDEIVCGPATAFHEHHILPLSHEEVAAGQGSLLRRMPGDRWQSFANLRLLYALFFTHPGKKLLFMGQEFAPEREWNPEISLDWHLLDDPLHAGVQRLVRDLNALYRSVPALHELDCAEQGFEWIDANDTEQSVISFLRKDERGHGSVVIVCNFTPVVRNGYRVGVPDAGFYAESLNTDAERYGGGNVGNYGGIDADEWPMHGRPFSLGLNLPPFAAVVLRHAGRRIHPGEDADGDDALATG